MKPEFERRILQVAIAVTCLVPLFAGVAAVIRGAEMLGGGGVDLDSHFRYLSGLLLGIGVAFLSTLPRIEEKSDTIRVLTFLVVIGGAARALGFLQEIPSPTMQAALSIELFVTPMLCLWQSRVARRLNDHKIFGPLQTTN
jgi:hypothetical protein